MVYALSWIVVNHRGGMLRILTAPADLEITCSASKVTLDPAPSATTSNLSGNSLTISRVYVPIDPVDPSSENFCIVEGVPFSELEAQRYSNE